MRKQQQKDFYARGKKRETRKCIGPTALMMDVLRLLKNMQKESQKALTTITDILTARDILIRQLTLMKDGPYPGGEEEKLLNQRNEDFEEEGVEKIPEGRRAHNAYVSTPRLQSSVRNEIILTSIEFLTQRLDEDQKTVVQRIQAFIGARAATTMIDVARKTVENLFGSEAVAPFCDEVIGHFESGNLPVPEIQSSSSTYSGTAQLYHLLKISVPGTIFSKLVCSFAALSPHSSGPERAVSCHTALKGPKQSCYSREALNSRMAIALNSCGTAYFDPRPSVARFLEKKNRRMRLPDKELYRNRDFVKKFFSMDSCV